MPPKGKNCSAFPIKRGSIAVLSKKICIFADKKTRYPGRKSCPQVIGRQANPATEPLYIRKMSHQKDIRIAVAGTGYVGLSIATLLSQHHHVTAVDVIPEKAELINARRSPIQDEYIERYAREELDYAKPGERIFVNIAGN